MNKHLKTLNNRRDISRLHKTYLSPIKTDPKKAACPIQEASRQVTKDIRKFRKAQQRKNALRPNGATKASDPKVLKQ